MKVEKFVSAANTYILGRCNISGAISLFLNITGAIAPIAPVLNTPLVWPQPILIKLSVFVYAQGIKTVHAGGPEGVKKWQTFVHLVVECPL